MMYICPFPISIHRHNIDTNYGVLFTYLTALVIIIENDVHIFVIDHSLSPGRQHEAPLVVGAIKAQQND